MNQVLFEKLPTLFKEVSEIIMFGAFSYEPWMLFFESYLQYLFLPIIAMSFVANLGLAVHQYLKAPEKASAFKIFLQSLSTLSIVAAISLKVSGVVFAFGPHLFLAGITFAVFQQAISFYDLAKSSRLNTHLAIEQSLEAITKISIFTLIAALFVFAAPAVVVSPIAVITVVLTIANLAKNISVIHKSNSENYYKEDMADHAEVKQKIKVINRSQPERTYSDSIDSKISSISQEKDNHVEVKLTSLRPA